MKTVLGKVKFGDAIPKIEGGWYDEWTGEYGVFNMKMEPQAMTYTEAMWKSHAPYNNPYQGTDKRVLFVCSAGILRSATAARMYAPKYNTRAAGSFSWALIPVTHELLLWADEVVFVNSENFDMVSEKFNLDSFPNLVVKVLNIPDNHEHMAPELKQAFEEQYEAL